MITVGVAAGPPPTPDRFGICSTLKIGSDLYVIDCGLGSLNGFTNAGLPFGDIKKMFITHLHADHIVDYYSFFLAGGNQAKPGQPPVMVYGPGPAGGLTGSQVGNPDPATINPANPTPRIAAMTASLNQAFAYTGNVLIRDQGIDDTESLMKVTEIAVPPGSDYLNRSLPYVFEGVPELVKPTWEWTTETASHAMRLIVTGVFDRYPRAQVILGHMGETLPFMAWRLDSRYQFTATERRVLRNPSDYLRDNFTVTTSGQCSDVPLLASLASMGQDRVMFSIDYPYESSVVAGDFIASAAVSEDVRARVGHQNAEALLKLGR